MPRKSRKTSKPKPVKVTPAETAERLGREIGELRNIEAVQPPILDRLEGIRRDLVE